MSTAVRSARMSRPLIAELLLAKGLVPEKGLEAALRDAKAQSSSLEETLVHAKLVTGEQIAGAYAEHLKMPLVFPTKAGLDGASRCSSLLPEKFLRDNGVLPLEREPDSLKVAFVDPSDLALHNEIQLFTGLLVVPVVAPLEEIRRVLDLLFGERNLVKETALELEVEEDGEKKNTDVLDLDKPVEGTDETLIVRLVNHILREAVGGGASDIHLEPFEDGLKVRMRVDGLLHEISPVPKSMRPALISRLKILSKLDIAEKRMPLDGAFSLRAEDVQMDVRVSTMPTIWGEKMVMRILNKSTAPVSVEALGLDKRQQEDFLTAAGAAHGLFFVTGPTGSGKSTTLYATLSVLKSPTKNLVTVEDPVEFKIPGVNQVCVRSDIGLTFASVLRAFLRQDPNIIMVGEVRDSETAEICMRAALTGHLVLSTLHTNDALSSVTRLKDLGIPPFLIAATLRGVVAQRLVRRLCVECKEPYLPDAALAARYGFPAEQPIYKPKGCEACQGCGYRGRMAIFEVYRVTSGLAGLIQAEASLGEIARSAREQGTLGLLDHGLLKVRQGLTSLEEVLRITIGDAN